MSYRVGLDLGTTYSAAAVARDGRVSIAALGTRSAVVPSLVHVAGGVVLVGEAAHARAMSDPTGTARGFRRRLGDPSPVLRAAGGDRSWRAEELMALLAAGIVRVVEEHEGGPADELVLAFPAQWGEAKQQLVLEAMAAVDGMRFPPIRSIVEPEAAAIHYAVGERIEPDQVVAVYDLGGGTFDAALLRRTRPDGAGPTFSIIGRSVGIDRLGGVDFDSAIFAHVNRFLGGALDRLANDAGVGSGLAQLRAGCVDAKETLSLETDVSIPVVIPGVPKTEVRVTRSEFEAMIRPAILETIGALRRALRTSDVETDDVATILLVGGSSRIPLVAQMLSEAFGRPIAIDAHPKHAVSLGAALSKPTANPRPFVTQASAAVGDSPQRFTYTLGIDLGSTRTTAAICRPDGTVEVASLGTIADSIPTVLYLDDDGTLIGGDAAERRAAIDPAGAARGFKHRLGDPTPIILRTSPWSAEALIAHMVDQVVQHVTVSERDPPEHVIVTHPAEWGRYRLDLLGQSFGMITVASSGLSEPCAAAIAYASQSTVPAGAFVAVYDLGGSTFDATILSRRSDDFEPIGHPVSIERLGGIEFDEAIFHYVREQVGERWPSDPDDPSLPAPLLHLRRSCTEAKELLSSEVEVHIPVLLPGTDTVVTITRPAFESMIASRLEESITALQSALASAGLEAGDLAAVLLVGGSSRIPLVRALLHNRFGDIVVDGVDPLHIIACGAAIAAEGRSKSSPITSKPVLALEEVPAVTGFRLVTRLGEGSYGSVYQAVDLDAHRTVAIKILDRSDASTIERLRREIAVMAGFNLGASIVPVVQVTQTSDGRPAIVMPFYSEGSLAGRLRRGVLSPWEAASVGLQLTVALREAHSHGMLHRNVKPSNALLGSRAYFLADLGVAGIDDPVESFGPGYASPEQCAGETTTTASDYYSLGLTMYAMVAGEGGVAELKVNRQPVAPVANLGALLLALTEPIPAARPNGEEVQRWLTTLLDELPRERTTVDGDPPQPKARSAGDWPVLEARSSSVQDSPESTWGMPVTGPSVSTESHTTPSSGAPKQFQGPRVVLVDADQYGIDSPVEAKRRSPDPSLFVPSAPSSVSPPRRRNWVPGAGALAVAIAVIAVMAAVFLR